MYWRLNRAVKMWNFFLLCNRDHGHPELIKLIVEERARRQKVKSKRDEDEEGKPSEELQEEEEKDII